MNDEQLAAIKSLDLLVDLKLSVTTHAGNMRKFGFGQLQPRDKGMIGEYSLHLQCPWRISDSRGLVTGSGDWYLPENEADFEKLADDSWDPGRGASLQEARLRTLLNNHETDALYITNNTNDLVATGVQADLLGGFELLLSPGYKLEVFPSSSRDEHWRLFKPDSDEPHFVMES